MPALLLTQCLQNDFVGPLDRFEPLPNLLHVGYSESLRLMGERPDQGPVSRVMSWAHSQPVESLQVIHLRDWHDSKDPAQANHLARFGNHCLQNTRGAEFAFAHSDPLPPGVRVLDSLSLNDFQGTSLADLLNPFRDQVIRVGLMGVWTEAKIFFLAYELCTRHPNFEVVVCSALTASSSRGRHFEALDQMERILGVRVVHSVGEFVDYLGGHDLQTPLLGLPDRFPEIAVDGELGKTDQVLLRYLFRDCRRLTLRILDGGFSGNLVLGTQSEDHHGHDQVPHVVKIGNQELMGQERVAFERIQHVLGNNAPQISEFADYQDKGAIKYRYASMGGTFSTTFQKLVEGGAQQSEIDSVLNSVFGEQLYRLYKACTLEETDLLSHYGFSSRWAEGVKRRVESLVSGSLEAETLSLGTDLQTPNLVRFYTVELDRLARGGRCYQAYVHGDLNGANIIIDGHRNVWLIDFFHTRRAHVLMDLIKLENDLLYIFHKLESQSDLLQASELVDELLEVDDLAAPLAERQFSTSRLQTTWDTVRKLRSFYPQLIHSDRSPYQWWVGALRYAAHSLGFDECSELQKRLALYTAGRLAQKIVDFHQLNSQLRVDWLPVEVTSPGRIGLTILPGRADRDRELSKDLAALRDQQVDSILCLVTQEELKEYGVPELLAEYDQAGFPFRHQPVVDQKVCSLEEVKEGVDWIQAQVEQGRSVLLHCVGGLGRSGFMAASFLVQQGHSAQEAIDLVRRHRSLRAVETALQEELVEQFAASRGHS